MFCKNCGKEMTDISTVCVECGTAKGDGNKYCHNCGGEVDPNASICVKCGIDINNERKSKIIAGILGLIFGVLGVHNFYLGYTKKALVQILLTLVGGIFTCGISSVAVFVWTLIESIMILTGHINRDGKGQRLKD